MKNRTERLKQRRIQVKTGDRPQDLSHAAQNVRILHRVHTVQKRKKRLICGGRDLCPGTECAARAQNLACPFHETMQGVRLMPETDACKQTFRTGKHFGGSASSLGKSPGFPR